MSRTPVTVTVVVVTWNSTSHLPSLAESLPAGLAGVPNWRLVVVDNDSSDGSPALARQLWPHARLIPMGRNAGYAAAINAATRTLPATEVVVAMNPDLRLDPGCVRSLLDALADAGVGIAVPRLLDPDGRTAPSIRRDPSVPRVWAEALLGGRLSSRRSLSETVREPGAYTTAHDVDWASGAMMAIAPACRSAVGEWDESFFLYSEEVDYCRRARQAGFAVRFVPSSTAMHVSGSYGTDVALWRLLVRNRAVDYRRAHGPLASAAFQLGLAAGQLLRAPGSAAHRAGVGAALTRRDPRDMQPPDPVVAEPGPGFVWFAAQDWWYHNQAHSDFQLMREVARTRPVLVVNSLGLRLPRRGSSNDPGRRIVRKLRSMTKLVRRPLPEVPNFHVMTPIMLPAYGDTRLARVNAWLVRQQVRRVARLVGAGDEPDVGVTIPTAWPVVAGMRRRTLLFNRSDLQSAFPEADGGWVRGLEHELLVHSDRVLYVSHELMRLDRQLVGDRAFFLDHGVDVQHFTLEGEVSPEIARIPRPRVGFFGGLDDYVVDLDLIRSTAESLPEVQIVLIGDATCPMEKLTALPNVHWLGYRPYAAIPALGRGFDVALMPWLDNEWIRFANPIKLKEYLALGLAVVTTEYPEVEDYRDRVRVATSRDDFPLLVRDALGDRTSPQERRDSVLDHTWQARARMLTELSDRIEESLCVG